MFRENILRKIQRFHRFVRFHPKIPVTVDQDILLAQAAVYFGLSAERIQEQYRLYQGFHVEQGYEKTLGERKTLSFEEAFLIYLSALRIRPSHVVEIGTQFGKSTRRIIDLLSLITVNSVVTCFDIEDALRFVSHQEVNLVIHDLTLDFYDRVLVKIAPGLIYLDAHPYNLLKTVISEYLKWSQSNPAILAIHDCSPGLYYHKMHISKKEPAVISSRTGLWERHVLSEIFSTANQELDDLETPAHHLRIFSTPHGLALIAPNYLLREKDWLLPA